MPLLPLNLVRLRFSSRQTAGHGKSVRQRVVRENLWNQANRDPLTSLPNRRSILKSLERNASICVQRDQPLGVMMIDLDFFKQINDTYGHDGGDAVLQEVAKRMMVSIRTSDTVGRFGGEEFMAVVPSCAGEELLRIAERIRSAVNRAPVTNGDQVIPVSCSIGVAVRWDSKDGTTQQSHSAPTKRFMWPKMGRNRVVSAWTLHDRSRKSSLMSKSFQFASISHELRSAIANIAQLADQLSKLKQYDESLVNQIQLSSSFLLRVVESVIDEDRNLNVREVRIDKIIEEVMSIRAQDAIPLEVWVQPDVPMALELCDIAVSRILRNLIQNIDSHSGASHAEVHVSVEADALHL